MHNSNGIRTSVTRRTLACPEQIEQRLNLSGLVISEFVAKNAASLLDEDGSASDWIEIQNASEEPVALENWRLTDDNNDERKWAFPKMTLESGEFLVVYASGKNRRSPDAPLHTNFKLSAQGEYLALFDPDGKVGTEYSPQYPPQTRDISYGLGLDGRPVYFETPTPARTNSAAKTAVVDTVQFNVTSGFYEQPISVELTSSSSGAALFYSTDGSIPTREDGLRYTQPLEISSTSVIRAVAFKEGLVASSPSTRSYIFVNDVASQSSETARRKGFESEVANDFEMDPRVAGPDDLFAGKYANQIVESLLAIPTLSLALDLDDIDFLFSNVGQSIAKPTSGEFIFPRTGEAVPFSSGVQIQGGVSRGIRPRNSFRLVFREEFGMSKFEYSLFGQGRGNEYDSIILRSSMGEIFDIEGVHYIRDAFIRRLQIATGNPSARSRFVHLYLNGLYWGMYEATERLDDQFMANHFGGDKDDWDVLRGDSTVTVANSGDTAAWKRLKQLTGQMRSASTERNHELYMQIQGKDPNGNRDPNLEVLLDVDNYIADLTVHWYGEVSDWLGNNYFIARNRTDGTGFRFFAWDTEYSMYGRRWRASEIQRFGTDRTNGPAALFRGLYSNESFRIRFSDLVQTWTSPGGALYVNQESPSFDPRTPHNNVPASIWAELAEEVRLPYIANSARWGDLLTLQIPFLPPLRTRDEYWTPLVESRLNNFFPSQTANFVRELNRAGLYRAAPTVDKNSGVVPAGQPISISTRTEGGEIFYTLDGSDPRAVSGEPSTSANVYSGPIRIDASASLVARVRDDDGWSALESHTYLVDPDTTATSLRISEVHYNPAPPTASEIESGFTRSSDFEYIEIQNTSDNTVQLSAATLTTSKIQGLNEGVEFDFSDAEMGTLKPNGFVVVARNPAAIRARYGALTPIAGAWTGRLDNSAETITLVVNGVTVQRFRYQDHWYPNTDGVGFSLVSANTQNSELFELNKKEQWRSSNRLGGSPGRSPFIIGDSNLDDVFNSSDLVQVFQANEYEDSIVGNSSWRTGDWSGDGDFNSTDLVLAFQFGKFERS